MPTAHEKYTYRPEEIDNNVAGQSLNKRDTAHIDDEDEVSSIKRLYWLCISENENSIGSLSDLVPKYSCSQIVVSYACQS